MRNQARDVRDHSRFLVSRRRAPGGRHRPTACTSEGTFEPRTELTEVTEVTETEREISYRRETVSPPLEVLHSRDLIVAFALEELERDAEGKRGLDWLVAKLVTHVRPRK